MFSMKTKGTTTFICDSSFYNFIFLYQHLAELIVLTVDLLHGAVVSIEIVRMVDLDQILVALPK